MKNETYEYYMRKALKEAQKAYNRDEVPIGAIIVKDGIVIARAHNLKELKSDATAHAEIIAIQKACSKLNAWRLSNCDLYVTLEPCPMCAGAIIQSRIRNVIIGTYDPKSGACGSVVDLFNVEKFNHKVELITGVLEEECSQILKDFFKNLRK